MRVWIMRHSEAGFNAKIDSQRSLTEKGNTMAFAQGKRFAKRIANQNVNLDKIIASPYVRTQQTVEQFILGMQEEQAVTTQQNFAMLSQLVETWEGITSSGNVDNVLNYLSFLKDEGCQAVLLISHLPLVYDLVQALTHYRHNVNFYPAVIAEVDWEQPVGKLLWVAHS